MKDLKIGVYVCKCGGNISDIIDVDKIVLNASSWENVVKSEKDTYLCSKPSIELVKKAIEEEGLDRIVLACCTPKMHKKKFERNFEEVGLNPSLLEIVNVREQGSWVHSDDPEGATLKALDLLRGSVAKVVESVPLEREEESVERSVMVVGGGIAGIMAALRCAEHGIKTYLVEKSSTIGGHMIQYPKVFPTLDCSQCILTPRLGDVAENPNIELFTLTEVDNVSGYAGNFKVRLRRKPRYVDLDKCTGCGDCSEVCPEEVENEFNGGLDKRKAIYRLFPQAIPHAYVIDKEACSECLKCEDACATDAINHEEEETFEELDVGAIIVATGYELYDLSSLGRYRYKKHPNVITSLQMERILDIMGPTKSALIKPNDGEKLEKVAYVLCAGSRDANEGLPYCSTVCCLYAMKEAILLKKRGVDVWLHYIDIRTPGTEYEAFYNEAQELGIHFVKGKIAEVIPDGDRLLVRAEDMLVNSLIENEVDLVVLCPPIIPSMGASSLAERLKAPLDEHGFFLEKHPKLDPLSTKREGIFVCGMASGPKDIQSSVAEAEGAALKAINFVQENVIIEPEKAFIKDLNACDGIGKCVEVCPVDALSIENGKVEIRRLICNGCGACVAVCPHNVLDLQGLTEEQLQAQIKGILADSEAEIKILAFVEKEIVYTAADITGVSRINYPSSIRIITVPSISRLKLDHILYAFENGADGVMLLEAPEHEGLLGKAHLIAEEKAEKYMDKMEEHDIDEMRLWFGRIYVSDWRKLPKTFETFDTVVKRL